MSITQKLLQGAAVADRGGFTVDAQKAREKLKRFRLADPLLYVVEVIQAAVLFGAQRVNVDVDADDVHIRFTSHAPALTGSALNDLESALLVRTPTTHAAVQQLALAMSAAQGLEPRFVHLSADGRRLEIAGESRQFVDDDATRALPDGRVPVHFHLKEAARVGHLVDFVRGLAGRTREGQLVRERLAYCHVTVAVNGRVVSGGPGPTDVAVDVIKGEVRVRVGFLPDPTAPSELILLRAGAIQEEVRWDKESPQEVPSGFFAIVDAGALDRDASYSRFIRNAAFKQAVQIAEGALPKLSNLLVDGLAASDPLALERGRRLAVFLGREVLSGSSKGHKALRSADLLRDPGGKGLSIFDLTHGIATSRVVLTLERAYTSEDVTDDLGRGDGPIVVHLRDALDKALLHHLRLSAADASNLLAVAAERRRKRRDFENRRRAFAASPNAVRRLLLESEHYKAWVCLREDGAGYGRIHVLVDGCALANLTFPSLVPGIEITLQGTFQANHTWDDVVRDARFAAAVRRCLASIPILLDGETSAREQRSPVFQRAQMGLLKLAADGDADWREARRALKLPDGEGLGPLSAIPLTGHKAHAVIKASVIPSFPAGTFVSLDALVRGDAPVGFINQKITTAPDYVPSISPTVIADAPMQTVLQSLVGRRLTKLDDEAIQAERLAAFRRGRNPTAASLDDVTVQWAVHRRYDEQIPWRGEFRTIQGTLGYRAGQTGIQVQLRLERRHLDRRVFDSPIPGLVLLVEDNGVRLSAKLQAESPGDLTRIALEEIPGLLAALADKRHPDAWALATTLVDRMWPTSSAMQAWRSMAARLDGPAATSTWRGIVRVIAGVAVDAVDRAFQSLLESQTPVNVITVEQALKKARRRSDPDPLLEVALAPAFAHPEGMLSGMLDGLGVGRLRVRTLEGPSRAFGELVRSAGPHRLSEQPGPVPPGFEDVLCEPLAHQLLRRLTANCVDVDADLVRARAELAFSARPQTTPVLPDSVSTVKVRTHETGWLRGQLGLLAGRATSSPQAEIELLWRGRPFTRVSLGQNLGVSMIGSVDVDDLTPLPDFSGVVHDATWERLVERLRQERETLVSGLADDALEEPTLLHVSAVRARFLERIRLARTSKKVAVPTSGLAGRLAVLPMWTTIGGAPRHLRDLAEGTARILPEQPPEPPPRGFEDVVVIEDEGERYVLGLLVNVVDVTGAWRQAVAAATHRSTLPPLPPWPAGPLLFQREVKLGDATLRLGLRPLGDPDRLFTLPNEVCIGHDDVEVERRAYADGGALPAVAVLSGPNVVRPDFKGAQVGSGLSEALVREAVTLWREALGSLEHNSVDDAHRPWLRAALATVCLHLGSLPPAELSTHQLGLRAQLRRAPLFKLWHDGHISLDDALTEDPAELRHRLRAYGFTPQRTVAPTPAPPRPTPPAEDTETPPAKTTTPSSSNSVGPPASAATTAVTATATATTATATTTTTTPPTPEEVFTSHLHDLLRAVSGGPLTSKLELDRLDVVTGKGKVLVRARQGRVTVDIAHPVAVAARSDGVALMLVASAVVTRLNEMLAQVTDDHEAQFMVRLARHALTMDAPVGTRSQTSRSQR